jgi:hypothetical protein
MNTVTKTLSFDEESELLIAVYTSIAYYKLLAKDSVDNKDYWLEKAEMIHKIADKFYAEMREVTYG